MENLGGMGTSSTDLNQYHGWQAIAEYGWRFARDEIELRIAAKTRDGQRLIAEPIKVVLQPYVDNEAMAPAMEPTVLPRDLAEVLFNAIGSILIGHKDPYTEINRLKSALAKSEQRVDDLIKGFGRLGGSVELS